MHTLHGRKNCTARPLPDRADTTTGAPATLGSPDTASVVAAAACAATDAVSLAADATRRGCDAAPATKLTGTNTRPAACGARAVLDTGAGPLLPRCGRAPRGPRSARARRGDMRTAARGGEAEAIVLPGDPSPMVGVADATVTMALRPCPLTTSIASAWCAALGFAWATCPARARRVCQYF